MSEDAERDWAIEQLFVRLRWLAAAFALFQVLTFYRPYPPGIEALALTIPAALACANVAVWWCLRRDPSDRAVRRLGAIGLAIDSAGVLALVVIHTFDQDTAMFALVYLLPILGAVRYGMRGAIGAMGVGVVAYALREWWGHAQYGNDLLVVSITFRMGIGVLIALAVGWLVERYRSEHRRVEELYHHERRAAEALRRLDELKSTFLSAVSHELRTPLTSVLGFSMTLHDQATELAPRSRTMLEHVVREAEHLRDLLDDLLDLDRIEHGHGSIVLSATDMGALVERLARRMAARDRRSVRTTVEHVTAIVDAPKVERLVENLLANAVKYAPASELIEVRLHARDGGVVIGVDDRGPGVPPELAEAVFEPFERGAEVSGHAPGTGIGLSLVDRFSKLHGGRAWVEQREGGGAAFRVFLPVEPPAATGAAAAGAVTPPE